MRVLLLLACVCCACVYCVSVWGGGMYGWALWVLCTLLRACALIVPFAYRDCHKTGCHIRMSAFCAVMYALHLTLHLKDSLPKLLFSLFTYIRSMANSSHARYRQESYLHLSLYTFYIMYSANLAAQAGYFGLIALPLCYLPLDITKRYIEELGWHGNQRGEGMYYVRMGHNITCKPACILLSNNVW